MAPARKKKSLLGWEGRTGSGSRGNCSPKGKAFLKEGGRVGTLDGFNGGSVCLFFPGGESDTRDRPDELAKGLEVGGRRLGSAAKCHVMHLKRSWRSQDREALTP